MPKENVARVQPPQEQSPSIIEERKIAAALAQYTYPDISPALVKLILYVQNQPDLTLRKRGLNAIRLRLCKPYSDSPDPQLRQAALEVSDMLNDTNYTISMLRHFYLANKINEKADKALGELVPKDEPLAPGTSPTIHLNDSDLVTVTDDLAQIPTERPTGEALSSGELGTDADPEAVMLKGLESLKEADLRKAATRF